MAALAGSALCLHACDLRATTLQVYPEVYDINERHLWSRFKYHGYVIERYEPGGDEVAATPSPAAEAAPKHLNPLANPELERKLKYWWKR